MKLITALLLMALAIPVWAELVWLQPPDPDQTAVARSYFYAETYWSESVDDFLLESSGELYAVQWWGHDMYAPGPALADHFVLRIYADDPGVPETEQSLPGEIIVEEIHLSWTEVWDEDAGQNRYFMDLHDAFLYSGGVKYWISLQVVASEVPVSGWGMAQTPVEFGWDGYYVSGNQRCWVIREADLAFGLYSDEPSAAVSSNWTGLKTIY